MSDDYERGRQAGWFAAMREARALCLQEIDRVWSRDRVNAANEAGNYSEATHVRGAQFALMGAAAAIKKAAQTKRAETLPPPPKGDSDA